MSEQDVFYNTILEEMDSGKLVLPTLPEVALQVREVVDDPEATAKQLADIITTDAALSARLLKVANSPLYRGRVAIDSVQMAVSRLGLSMVRNLVTSLVMEQMFQATNNRLDKRLRSLWEQSTKVAAASQVIAAKLNGIRTDEAMLAGLIHAIGVLPILMKADEDGDLIRDSKKLDQLIDNPRNGNSRITWWQSPANMPILTATAVTTARIWSMWFRSRSCKVITGQIKRWTLSDSMMWCLLNKSVPIPASVWKNWTKTAKNTAKLWPCLIWAEVSHSSPS